MLTADLSSFSNIDHFEKTIGARIATLEKVLHDQSISKGDEFDDGPLSKDLRLDDCLEGAYRKGCRFQEKKTIPIIVNRPLGNDYKYWHKDRH